MRNGVVGVALRILIGFAAGTDADALGGVDRLGFETKCDAVHRACVGVNATRTSHAQRVTGRCSTTMTAGDDVGAWAAMRH